MAQVKAAKKGKPKTRLVYRYTAIIQPDPDSPGWWNAEIPALPGCVSCGQSYAEAVERIQEAALAYLLALKDRGKKAPADVAVVVEVAA